MPEAVNHLIQITGLRITCKEINIEKIDLGSKGMNIKFRNNKFDKSDELVTFITKNSDKLKMRTDQSLVYRFNQINKLDNIRKAFQFIDEIAIL